MNDVSPYITIVVPTYNEELHIGRCLEAIKQQDYPKELIETIVVDNFSSDKTLFLAKKFKVKIYIKGPERSAQRNFGAKVANEGFLVFLDSDIELSSNVITECMELVKQGYKVITFPEIIVGEGLWAKCRALEARCYLGDNSIEAPRFYKSTVFAELGGFDENLVAGEDWDLRERAIERGFTIGRITALTMHHEGRVSLITRLKSKYYYGETIDRYLMKHKGIQWKQFPLFRSCYYSHWKLLAKDPLHTIGFIIMKGLESVAVGLALINSRIKSWHKVY